MTLQRRCILLAIPTLLAVHSRAEAQTTAPSPTSGVITGRVVDSTAAAPVNQANVDVSISGAKTSVAHGTTAADGSFRVEGLQPGRYSVRVRALGYTPRPLPRIEISAASSNIDLGTVFLISAPVQLQSLQVTGQRQDVQLAPDRNTYIVRDMPTTRGGTALDVLRNVPSVDVDIDNVVSLRGNSGVVVQINGRPSPMKPAQLGNFLAQLPADVVDKVEVVTNPSARDDPEGIAGIINIVLKEKPEAGKSGGLTLGADPVSYAIAYASAVAGTPLRAFTVRSTSSALPPFAAGMSRTTYVLRSGASCTSCRFSVTATDSSFSATVTSLTMPRSTIDDATATDDLSNGA